ncbi:hypothetical protein HX804_03730 [Marine Group I thaumarchaeote]|jgi:hypothetical protein|uniref:Uncharacterized protein n=1 Tax=Marine Group I thaumarchaeote TaxID=2511932 RepID=A0A7K4NM66_9ARCH|nr:hypothetical protein [Marine Group I thaumarchaeote]
MKKFIALLLSVILVTLIAGSVQSIYADHLEQDQGIFVSDAEVILATTEDSNYQVYLQMVLRNGDDQLINVTESTANGSFIPHKITDHVFDTLMGEKEIITIDNIKYEKVQYIFNPTLEQRFLGLYPIFSAITLEFISEPGPQSIKLYEESQDYSIWKIHYCAEFEGHGLHCIPIFQVLVPTMTIEPDDVVTHQWTVLRVLS